MSSLEWWYDTDIWPGPDSFEGFTKGTPVCYRGGMGGLLGWVVRSIDEVTTVDPCPPESTAIRIIQTFKTDNLYRYPGEPLAT